MEDTAIRLSNVRYRWPSSPHPVIDIPSFEVARGERVFVRGPSGSGKTTLLNLLGGVAVPEAGTVTVLDTDIASLGGARRDAFRADHIGFIFQMFNLVPYLSIIENVVLPCRFSPLRQQRLAERGASLEDEARRLLEHMELAPDAHDGRGVAELSVGQQQRVAVARSLIGAPDIVIADEPTSALDADARRLFLDLLFREVEDARATLLFVSHDARLAQAFDRSLALADINRVAT
ncbi:MAG TPA: methionine ABC transporter ATP-binding protein [Dehalococcoidia bacterium]|jgi:putative ABC transport system ATP-binding protein|nr:methionine ABC transporter ATP-binding protein [Dehalococcoidia bacterium]